MLKSCNCSLVQFVLKLFHYDPCVLWGSRNSMFFSPCGSLPLSWKWISDYINRSLIQQPTASLTPCMAESPHTLQKEEDMASFDKNRSASGWWVCCEKKGIVVPRQTEGTLSATLSDNRKQAEPITEEHKRQTEEGQKKTLKNGGEGCEVSHRIHRSDQVQFIKARWRERGRGGKKNRLPL